MKLPCKECIIILLLLLYIYIYIYILSVYSPFSDRVGLLLVEVMVLCCFT